MNQELLAYQEMIKKPWGLIFYKEVWEQLNDVNNKRILDFGSGFGYTANHFAENNEVIAIEPNEDMVSNRVQTNRYLQVTGNKDKLKELDSDSFDLILCHNVLEYTDERNEIVNEFSRLLKKGGTISVIKHNHAGRIMQKVVFENNIDEAMLLLDGGDVNVMNFGKVRYYDNNDIVKWCGDLTIENVFGIRAFWALQQNNDIKFEPDWLDKMLQIEMKVCNMDAYKNISFFNHVILKL